MGGSSRAGGNITGRKGHVPVWGDGNLFKGGGAFQLRLLIPSWGGVGGGREKAEKKGGQRRGEGGQTRIWEVSLVKNTFPSEGGRTIQNNTLRGGSGN